MQFDSKEYLRLAYKLFVYDHASDPENAGHIRNEMLKEAIEFTFPYDGEGRLWLRKFIEKIGDINAE